MSITKKHDSTTAQIIDAGADAINGVKNPLFILLLICIGGFGYFTYVIDYKLLDTLIEIKVALLQQNDLVAKQNVLLDNMKRR